MACTREKGHAIARFQVLQDSIIEENFCNVLNIREIDSLIEQAPIIRQHVNHLVAITGIHKRKAKGSPSTGPDGLVQASQYRWVLFNPNGTIGIDGEDWCYGEAAAHAAAETERKARPDRSLKVQVWQRQVPAPTLHYLQEGICMYLMQTGGETVLAEDCEYCVAEADGDEGGDLDHLVHQCKWPRDPARIKRVLLEVQVVRSTLGDMVARATRAMGDRLNTCIPATHDEVVASATAKLLAGECAPAEIEQLLDNMDYLEQVDEEPDFFGF